MCNNPIIAYYGKELTSSGKQKIVFSKHQTPAGIGKSFTLPCGGCIPCRANYSLQWAIRCYHESTLYQENSYITLTYSPKHLPKGGTLVKKHFQDFLKRLRKTIHPQKLRYYMCGEYGEQLSRPHFHACIFGYDFKDKTFWQFNKYGDRLYRSAQLEQLWPFGYITIGEVTFKSAAYIARYIMKKVNGTQALNHYEKTNIKTGEITRVLQEYTNMSLKPGIGYDYYQQNKDKLMKTDEVHVNDRIYKTPKFYTKMYRLENPAGYKAVMKKRREYLKSKSKDKKNGSKRINSTRNQYPRSAI